MSITIFSVEEQDEIINTFLSNLVNSLNKKENKIKKNKKEKNKTKSKKVNISSVETKVKPQGITEINNLPLEIQNKIFYYYAEHPIATIFKKEIEVKENKACQWLGANLKFYWAATGEYLRTTYLKEDRTVSFILEDDIRTKNIGRFK